MKYRGRLDNIKYFLACNTDLFFGLLANVFLLIQLLGLVGCAKTTMYAVPVFTDKIGGAAVPNMRIEHKNGPSRR